MSLPDGYSQAELRERRLIFDWLSRPATDDGSAWMTPGEAAAMLGITTRRLANYTRKGGIRSIYTPGGHHRYIRADVQALLRITGKSPGRLPPPDTLRLAEAHPFTNTRNDGDADHAQD